MIYLDNAATTLIKPPAVAKRMKWAVNNLASPGRGGYGTAMAAADIVYECREKAARLFNVQNPERIVFTSNATHALNIAIGSLLKPGKRVLISAYEHNSVVRPIFNIGAKVEVADSKLFDRAEATKLFERKMTPEVSLVVINHVSNVFGYELPVEEIAKLCRERGIPFIVDASQSAGVKEIDFKMLGADFIAMPGHKGLYGPQGSGILICGDKLPIPLLSGGTGSNSLGKEMPDFLPDRLEAGTHNMPGIAGLSAGLDFIINTGVKKIEAHEKKLIRLMIDGLKDISGMDAYAAPYGACQTGVLSFNLRNVAPEIVGEELGKRNIAVRAGLHCSPLAHKTAGTLPAGTVRASVSAFSKRSDVFTLLNACEDIAKRY